MNRPNPARTPFARLQNRLGFMNKELAAMLGVTAESVSRWRHGHENPPKIALLCMKLMLKLQRSISRRVEDAP